ncbi:hypothetical protein WN51_01751 [Melipona quadrifasciata]|uniref:Uncharacterized protein n=1 Tax=Melipona quadrifasciata TaxID=166423 RepID=A0A0M9A012_9HYME|nr:hypothetical protein WN51_01751 [Melipona quadrifasciata]
MRKKQYLSILERNLPIVIDSIILMIIKRKKLYSGADSLQYSPESRQSRAKRSRDGQQNKAARSRSQGSIQDGRQLSHVATKC